MSQPKSPKINLVSLLAVSTIALSGVISLSGCASKEAAAAPAPISVDLYSVQPQAYQDSAEFMAQVNSKNATTIHPQVSSRVTRVLVTDGQLVQAGQPLYQLDVSQQTAVVSSLSSVRSASLQEPGMIQKNIESLQADLSAAQSDLAFNRKQLKRYQELLAQHTVSIRDTEQYQTTVLSQEQKVKGLLASIAQQQSHRKEALANVGRDTATVQSARANLAYYTVRAPFAGNVGTLTAKVGDVVDPSMTLTTLTDNRNLEIDIAVSADYRSKLHIGTPVEIFSMTDEPLGRIQTSYIDPKVDPLTQTFLLKAKSGNLGNHLAMDQHIKARLIWGEKSAILVPLMSVFRVDGQPFVYKAERKTGKPSGQPGNNDMVATMQAVNLGAVVDQSVVVNNGLKPGDWVVQKGIQKLQEGTPIAQGISHANEPTSTAERE